MNVPAVDDVLIEVTSPRHDAARAALRAYIEDVASRWLGRPATTGEVSAALLEDPSDDLVAPDGVLFLLARRGSVVLGCAGLRLLPGGVGEVRRVFVAAQARRLGVGRRLMLELEDKARARGLSLLRQDTRSELVEARALYAALGYVEVLAFNAGQYAEHWFTKQL